MRVVFPSAEQRKRRERQRVVRRWYRGNQERIRQHEAQKRRHRGVPTRAEYRAQCLANRKMPATPEQRKDARLRRLYNITLDDYNALYRAQGGVCAICRQPEKLRGRDGSIQPLSVDHSHVTLKVRGLLCNECNTAIGKLQDDVERVRRVIEYLEGTHAH